jgi:NAD(P)-dependent dehydrogenase (short-subunit alcohol dehydrogenase family)
MAMRDVRRIDYVVLNAGILRYPNVSTMRIQPDDQYPNKIESNRDVLTSRALCVVLALNLPSSFADFADHLKTNAIGPTIVAQNLIKTRIPIGSIVFMSSDSGSATEFRIEDGYGKLYR